MLGNVLAIEFIFTVFKSKRMATINNTGCYSGRNVHNIGELFGHRKAFLDMGSITRQDDYNI